MGYNQTEYQWDIWQDYIIYIPSGYDIHSSPWKIHPFLRTVKLHKWTIYTMATKPDVC